jgi:hypothetical protein
MPTFFIILSCPEAFIGLVIRYLSLHIIGHIIFKHKTSTIISLKIFVRMLPIPSVRVQIAVGPCLSLQVS